MLPIFQLQVYHRHPDGYFPDTHILRLYGCPSDNLNGLFLSIEVSAIGIINNGRCLMLQSAGEFDKCLL